MNFFIILLDNKEKYRYRFIFIILRFDGFHIGISFWNDEIFFIFVCKRDIFLTIRILNTYEHLVIIVLSNFPIKRMIFLFVQWKQKKNKIK